MMDDGGPARIVFAGAMALPHCLMPSCGFELAPDRRSGLGLAAPHPLTSSIEARRAECATGKETSDGKRREEK